MTLDGRTLTVATVFVEPLLFVALGNNRTETGACNVIKVLVVWTEWQPIGRALTLAHRLIVDLAPRTLGHIRTLATAGWVMESLIPRTIT